MTLDPVGFYDPSIECSKISIDPKTDFLQFVRIAYNTTGVFGLTFDTFLGKTYSYGPTLTDKSLKVFQTGLKLENGVIKNVFVGFQGTH